MKKITQFLFPVFLLLPVFLLPVVLAAQGSEYRKGEMIRISPDDTVRNQLFVAGEWVEIQGYLGNDLFAAGQDVVLDGQVGDDAFLAGRSVSFRGEVADMLMAAGESVLVDGLADGDVFVAGRTLHLTEEVRIGGRLFAAGAQVRVEGSTIGGSTRVAAGSVYLDGQFNGPVEIYSNDVTFGEEFQATGVTRIHSNRELNRNELGNAPENLIIEVEQKSGFLAAGLFYLWYLLSLLVTGLILLFLFRPAIVRLHDHAVEHAWLNIGVGLVAFIAIPFLVVLLFIPVITIPLALIIAVFYGLFLYFSQLLAALVVGMLILSRTRGSDNLSSWYWSLPLGLALIGLLIWIPIIGIFICFAVLFFGLGSILTSLWSSYRR